MKHEEMKALIEEALAEGVALEKIFKAYVPRAHELQKESFERASQVPLIVSFWFEDVDERYTFEFSSDGAEVEADEMIDFPVATIVLQKDQWSQLRPHLLTLLVKLQENRTELEERYVNKPITDRMLTAFESLRGTIRVNVEGLELKVVLNDYVEESGAPEFTVELTHALLGQVASGDVSPRELANKVKIKGQMSFALELAGFLSKNLGL